MLLLPTPPPPTAYFSTKIGPPPHRPPLRIPSAPSPASACATPELLHRGLHQQPPSPAGATWRPRGARMVSISFSALSVSMEARNFSVMRLAGNCLRAAPRAGCIKGTAANFHAANLSTAGLPAVVSIWHSAAAPRPRTSRGCRACAGARRRRLRARGGPPAPQPGQQARRHPWKSDERSGVHGEVESDGSERLAARRE